MHEKLVLGLEAPRGLRHGRNSAAVRAAEERCSMLGSNCQRDHVASKAAINELTDVNARSASHLTGKKLPYLDSTCGLGCRVAPMNFVP